MQKITKYRFRFQICFFLNKLNKGFGEVLVSRFSKGPFFCTLIVQTKNKNVNSMIHKFR